MSLSRKASCDFLPDYYRYSALLASSTRGLLASIIEDISEPRSILACDGGAGSSGLSPSARKTLVMTSVQLPFLIESSIFEDEAASSFDYSSIEL